MNFAPFDSDDRNQRALMLGGAVAALLLTIRFAIVPGMGSIRSLHNEIGTQRELLARERGVQATRSRISSAYDSAADRLLALAPLTFGTDRTRVRRLLENHVRDLAQASHVYLRTTASALGSDPVAEGLGSVTLEIEGESDFEGILTFLHGLESSRKLVVLNHMRIVKIEDRSAADGGGPEVLRFRLGAVAYRLPSADSVGSPQLDFSENLSQAP